MKRLSPQLLSLMTQAAELRAGGASWAKVGEKLGRSAETCRQWPRQHPDEWCRLYREAEGDITRAGSSEAAHVMRNLLLQSKDEKVRVAAATFLARKREHEIEQKDEAKDGPDDDAPPEVLRFLAHLLRLDHEQFQKEADDYLARNPAPSRP